MTSIEVVLLADGVEVLGCRWECVATLVQALRELREPPTRRHSKS